MQAGFQAGFNGIPAGVSLHPFLVNVPGQLAENDGAFNR